MYIYTETQYIGHNKLHSRLPTHKSLSEHVLVERIIACLCTSRPKDELDCELEVTTGNDFDDGKANDMRVMHMHAMHIHWPIQCCRDNDRRTSMKTCYLLVSVTLSCSTKSNSLSSLASKHLVSRKIRRCFMEKGVRMFVRQACSSCRQEKLSTICSTSCLQVVYKQVSTILYANQIVPDGASVRSFFIH